MGNPAKVVRFIASDAAPEVSRTRVAPAAKPVPVATVVRAAAPTFSAVPEREHKKSRRAMVSAGPYLPVTGSLPLRFSSTRDWPPPLSEAAPAMPEDTGPAVAEVMSPPTSPANVMSQAEAPASPAPKVAVPSIAKSVAAAPASPASTMLTADMVLGFLGNLPPTETERVAVRFEPAIPQRVNDPSALAPLAP